MTALETDELYEELQSFVGLPAGEAAEARDPVNEPMIRHWCDAVGDDNPVYTDPVAAGRSLHRGVVAPPTMLQVWNMRGLKRPAGGDDAHSRLMARLDSAGFTSVVATNCDQEYRRYLRPGDLLTESGVIESISPLKRTSLGDGHFVTTLRTYTDQRGEVVGTMRFRLLKFRPRGQTAAPAAPAPVAARPAVNQESAFFWEGTKVGELRIQRCRACGTLRHPPSPGCGRCGSLDWDFVVASGRGRVYSYVVHHHPPVPSHAAPFVVLLVELEEGTRVVGNLVGTDPARVEVGREVAVEFVTVDDELVLPQWRLVG